MPRTGTAPPRRPRYLAAGEAGRRHGLGQELALLGLIAMRVHLAAGSQPGVAPLAGGPSGRAVG